MSKESYTVYYDGDLNPTVVFYPSGRKLTGTAAKNHLWRDTAILTALEVPLLPLRPIAWMWLKLHLASSRALERIFAGRS